MTDDDVEKIIKRNMNLQMNLAGIRADFEEHTQHTWVGLTESDRRLINFQWQDGNGTATEIIDLVEAKLKEKNT